MKRQEPMQNARDAVSQNRLKRTILIIDDDESVRQYLVGIFERDGWTTLGTDSGRIAVQISALHQIDLILLDLELPDMHGFDVLGRINAIDDAAPVVIVSGDLQESSVVEAFELGASDYVRKPFSGMELLRRAGRLLRPKRVSRHITSGPIYIDVGRRLLEINGSAVSIPPMTLDVLICLIAHRGELVTNSSLLQLITKSTVQLKTRRVAFHIGALRRIQREHGIPDFIRTVHSVGFEWIGPSRVTLTHYCQYSCNSLTFLRLRLRRPKPYDGLRG